MNVNLPILNLFERLNDEEVEKKHCVFLETSIESFRLIESSFLHREYLMVLFLDIGKPLSVDVTDVEEVLEELKFVS